MGGPCRSRLVIAVLGATLILQSSETSAQCTARDVLQNQLKLQWPPSASAPRVLVRSAANVPAWKTITLGSFANAFALYGALNAAGCSIGGLAAEILARPAFVVSSTKIEVGLVTVSAVELGFSTDTVTLAAIYERAKDLGFGLAAPEIGPQLRLQYFDQPVGEFLIIGMDPITTWSGEQGILNVANGGAGLILIGQDGRADAEISATSRFVFVRSDEAVPADQIKEAVALAPPK
nr:hypothetical protein [Bradyrhizobium centrosematis]